MLRTSAEFILPLTNGKEIILLNPELSKVIKVKAQNPTRFAENHRSLNRMQINYPYLDYAYDMQSNPKVTSDTTYQGRHVVVKINMNGFDYLFY